ncbi:MAG: carboxylesterase/lipase family protein [Caulobacteraceae bacterium]
MITQRLSLLAGLLIAASPLASAAAATTGQGFAPTPVGAQSAPAPDTGDHPIVVAPAGTVEGLTIGDMDTYRGIPYAAPPVGALRWQPPQPANPWSGTLKATKFANHCPQLGGSVGIASTTEDCLFLNVFVPKNAGPKANLPVMVWFHGGGFSSGESDDYNLDKWVEHGRVVVTLNYRLGVLGFLTTTGLEAEPHPQVNYGILDQRAALEWVRTNIAAFGGNPRNTTILGQSAGGASVVTHLVSPGSKGLFQGALIQSGSYVFLQVQTLATALANGNAFAANVGCAATDTACLRAVSVKKILAAPSPGGVTAIAGGLTVDGTILPQAPLDALLAQQYTHVPIVQGTNHDEFRLFIAELFDLAGAPLSADEYPFFVEATLTEVGLGADTARVLAKYPLSNYASPDLAASAMATDAAFATTAVVSDNLLALGTPVYAYEFADENCPDDFLPPVSFPYGAAHEFELPFLGDSFTRTLLPLTPAERRLSATMIDYWTQFSGTGSPDNWNTPLWLPYFPLVADVSEFVPATPYMSTRYADFHKTAFWAELAGLGSLGKAGEHGANPAPLAHGVHPRFVTIEALANAARKLRLHAN